VDISRSDPPIPLKPLRLWPGVVIAIGLAFLRYFVPLVAPDAMLFRMPLAMLGLLGGILGGLAIVVWWALFSRAPWSERVGAVLVMIVSLLATSLVVHPSIAGGHMGMMLPMYAIPVWASRSWLGQWPAVACLRGFDALR